MEELNINNESVNEASRMKNNSPRNIIIGIICAVFFIAVIIAIASSGNDSSNNNSSTSTTTQKVEVINLSMTTTYKSYMDGYDCEITGIVRNNTKKSYSYVSVSISIYDANGIIIGSAYESMSDLGAGESWSFSTSSYDYPSNQPVSCKVKEITYW